MKAIKSVVTIILLLGMVHVIQAQSVALIPIERNHGPTFAKLETLGIRSEKIARAIDLASRQSGISQNFLIALMWTESAGKQHAVSSMGYKGLMQIPWPVYYEDANIIIGAHIFNEKMRQANSLENAICLYKGYKVGSERGLQQARKVLTLYDQLSEAS